MDKIRKNKGVVSAKKATPKAFSLFKTTKGKRSFINYWLSEENFLAKLNTLPKNAKCYSYEIEDLAVAKARKTKQRHARA